MSEYDLQDKVYYFNSTVRFMFKGHRKLLDILESIKVKMILVHVPDQRKSC